MMPQGGQIQIIPGTNQAIITSPITVQTASPAPAPQQKTVAIKPSSQKRRQNNASVHANVVRLPSGLTLPLNVSMSELEGAQVVTDTAAAPVKGKRGRKRQVAIAPPTPQPASLSPVAEQVEALLIETTADNIIQVSVYL